MTFTDEEIKDQFETVKVLVHMMETRQTELNSAENAYTQAFNAYHTALKYYNTMKQNKEIK